MSKNKIRKSLKEEIRETVLLWADDYSEDNCVDSLCKLFDKHFKRKLVKLQK